MDQSLETRIGLQIDAALERIQSKVGLVGMAGKFHADKASDMLQDLNLVERDVGLLGEHAEAEYLAGLPGLIEQTVDQDRRSADAWEARACSRDATGYLAEREKLRRLFPQFRFRPKVYERLVRQPDKPVLRKAIELLSAGRDSTPDARALEAFIRMSLAEFVALEEGLAADLQELDAAREELCVAHEGLALEVARSQPSSDPSTVASAMVGLRRAAAWYDHKRGYPFAEYARHWIQEAIDKRRG